LAVSGSYENAWIKRKLIALAASLTSAADQSDASCRRC